MMIYTTISSHCSDPDIHTHAMIIYLIKKKDDDGYVCHTVD